MVLIVDYGMGNIHSVQKACEVLGAKTCVSSSGDDLKKAEKIILPGVGAFSDAMDALNSRNLSQQLIEEVKIKQKPFLGICLGMQLLFNDSEEGLPKKGFGLISGSIKRFVLKKEFKVPHIGWNQIRIKGANCPLLNDVPDSSFMYFCHSYYPQPKDKKVVAASTEYGVEFPSLVWEENIFGTQFHPEKSQKAGLKIIDNFIKL